MASPVVAVLLENVLCGRVVLKVVVAPVSVRTTPPVCGAKRGSVRQWSRRAGVQGG